MSLTPELLLHAYSVGVFPMSEHRDDPDIFWLDPQRRGIIPLRAFHISRTLARRMRRGGYAIRIDSDFDGVVTACADRPETWINADIAREYTALHRMGYAHSLEVWSKERQERLIGGVYGVALGSAFFGESMFSRETDASKIALAYLVDRLRSAGFSLFDTQFLTDHLASLGAVEISRAEYQGRLARALTRRADFTRQPVPTAQAVIQRNTQTS